MSTVVYFKQPRPDAPNLEEVKAQCWYSRLKGSRRMPTEIVEALIETIETQRANLISEHRLMTTYSDRGAAIRRALREAGAIAHHEEITNLKAIERLQLQLEALTKELTKANLDAEIYEAMWDDMNAKHNACVAESWARLSNIRKALNWLWGFYDGNTLVAKPGHENDIQDAWIKLLKSAD